MPHGDQTGPSGQGPMTGRGMGHCAGYKQPGLADLGLGFAGRGAGRGRGGRGFRNQFHATGLTGWQRAQRGMQAWGTPQPEETAEHVPARSVRTQVLENRAELLEAQLSGVREALSRLQAE